MSRRRVSEGERGVHGMWPPCSRRPVVGVGLCGGPAGRPGVSGSRESDRALSEQGSLLVVG